MSYFECGNRTKRGSFSFKDAAIKIKKMVSGIVQFFFVACVRDAKWLHENVMISVSLLFFGFWFIVLFFFFLMLSLLSPGSCLMP